MAQYYGDSSPISPRTHDPSSSTFSNVPFEKAALHINTTQSNTLHHRNTHSQLPPPTPGNDRKPSARRPYMPSPYTWWQIKRALSRPLVWVLIVVAMIMWYSSGTVKDINSPEMRARLKDLFPPEITKNLKYWPASHNRIHVGSYVH